MKGKRGLIMGVANDHSIAWGIAKALHAQGAELAFTYQGEALGKRVKPLAEQLGVPVVLPCDVEDIASVDRVFETLREKWRQLDFLVHAIGFSDKNELKGRYADTTRENFSRTMVISCFSFTELAKRAAELMPASGGAGAVNTSPQVSHRNFSSHQPVAEIGGEPRMYKITPRRRCGRKVPFWHWGQRWPGRRLGWLTVVQRAPV